MKKWKLTSYTVAEAIALFGATNVRLGRNNGLGQPTVEVYVK